MAVRFDAASDRVAYTGGAPAPSAGFTLTAWVLVAVDTNDFATIARLYNGGTAVTFATSSDGLGGPNYFTGGGTITSSTGFAIGEWRKVAISCTGTSGALYVATAAGATEVDTGTVSGAASPTAIALGGRAVADSGEWWNGRLAYVRVWDAVLSQAEIEAEWASTTPVRTANLWADWPLEVHTDLTDHSGAGRHLAAGSTSTTTEDGPPLTTPITGSGSFTAPASAVSGAGAVIVSGAGAATADAADVAGDATVVVSGSGTAAAPASTLSGAGATVVAGQAALAAAGAVIAGTGQAIVTGSGVLVAPAGVVSGVGGDPVEPTETPASRTYLVPAGPRMFVVPAESRTVEA